MTQQDIYELLANGERVTLECKKAKNAVPNSVWETYSALANTYGGKILLGVEENLAETDKRKRFTISGVDDADKVVKDMWNMLNNKEKVNINLLHDEDVTIVKAGDRDVIAINVPRADCLLRPIYINGNLSKGTFRRNNEGDYHCAEHELRMMMRDSNEAGNDNLFIEYYTMDDIDIPSLERYRILFRTDHPDHVWNNLPHKEFLMQLGGYMVNRKEQTEGLTIAGLLMFGKGLPIRERFDNLRMDYIDKTNLIGDQRYSDRLTYDGTWENNLFNFMQIVLPRLTRDLPRPFRMEGMVRKDDTPQHKAVREAFTNAIIHADLMLNGILKIEKYDDRLVLTNPGLLKLPLEQIYSGGESKARNQRMQAMLRMIGYGENIGSGFPLILSAWKEKHWLKPELIEQPELMQVKLVLRIRFTENGVVKYDANDNVNGVVKNNGNININGVVKNDVNAPVNKDITTNVVKGVVKGVVKDGVVKNDVNDSRNGVVKNDANGVVKLSEIQKEIIEIVTNNQHMTIKEISLKANVPQRTLSRNIQELRDKGLITRQGSNKAGIWIVNNNINKKQ